MEKVKGPINPCLFEEENPALGLGCYTQLLTTEEDFRFEEYTDEQQQLQQLQQQQTQQYTLPSLEDKMPFLQMLHTVECASFLQEPNFQLLLKLQSQEYKKMPWNTSYELESCVTNDIVDFYSSPAKSEPPHETLNLNSGEILSSGCKQLEQAANPSSRAISKQTQMAKAPVSTKEKRKRKRTKLSKNKEEVESQRMTHIAVERNRRRQMNEHLNALRSLMPSSYVQRGDQASIIGGAIDFVKELEQLLQSLQAQKRMRRSEDSNGDVSTGSTSTSSSNLLNNLFMGSISQMVPTMSPPASCTNLPDNDGSSSAELEAAATETTAGMNKGDEFMAENRSPAADVDVIVIQNHVSLKVQCQRKPPGQLIRAILALEDLRLTVLHLNITSFESLIHYSFNLKIEDDCKLRCAAEIAGAVHQIFSLINNLQI